MNTLEASVLSASEGRNYTIGAWKITDRVLGSQTDGRFEMYYFVLPAGEEVAYHVHDRATETIYVLKGEVEFNVAGKKFPGKPGAVAFVPMHLHHGFRNHTSEPAEVILAFSPSTSQNEFFQAMQEVFAGGAPDLARVKQLQEQYDQVLVPLP